MRQLVFFILVSLFFLGSAWGRPNWRAEIAKESVKLVGGKMVIEDYSICAVKAPSAKRSSLQIRSYTEAPTDAGISRDFVVSFSSALSTVMVLTFAAAVSPKVADNPMDALDCHDIEKPIGKVDFEINLFMTNEGYQVEFVDSANGKNVRESQRWAEMFPGE